jgi:hypothetical protein
MSSMVPVRTRPGGLTGPFPGAMRTDRRDDDRMRSHGRCAAETGPLIDIGSALDLLATAVDQRGEHYGYPPIPAGHRTRGYAASSGSQCIVGHALSLAQVSDEGLEALRDRGVRELYAQGQLPVRLTLGALAVLDAAQRAQDRGHAWGDALEDAARVALRFLDLLPDAAFSAATSDLDLVAFAMEPLEPRSTEGGSCRGFAGF